MKRFPGIILLCFLLGFSASSCRKYEDGPVISFKSRKTRVVNSWKIDVVFDLETEKDRTEDFETFTIDLLEDGAFISTITDEQDSVHTQLGLWDLVNDDTQIRLLYTEPLLTPDRSYWEILRLKEEELWVKNMVDSIWYETRLIP